MEEFSKEELLIIYKALVAYLADLGCFLWEAISNKEKEETKKLKERYINCEELSKKVEKLIYGED